MIEDYINELILEAIPPKTLNEWDPEIPTQRMEDTLKFHCQLIPGLKKKESMKKK